MAIILFFEDPVQLVFQVFYIHHPLSALRIYIEEIKSQGDVYEQYNAIQGRNLPAAV